MPTLIPQDPDYVARVRASFDRQRVMAWIGATLTRLAPGQCEITLPHKPELTQQHGYVHGGIIGTIGDTAAGYAGYTLMPHDASVLTVEYKSAGRRRTADRARRGHTRRPLAGRSAGGRIRRKSGHRDPVRHAAANPDDHARQGRPLGAPQ
jgi:acyl-coenzyme A thioesterase PaaI-like protein